MISLWGDMIMKFTISCLLTLQMLHTKFGMIVPVVFDKMLTHDAQRTMDDGRRTTTDANP